MVKFSNGPSGIHQTKATILKNMEGTHSQCISLLVLFWWLSPYSAINFSIFLIIHPNNLQSFIVKT